MNKNTEQPTQKRTSQKTKRERPDRPFITPFLDSIDSILAWFSTELKQTVESYCDLETADDVHTLVARDGSLLSVVRV